MSEVKMSEAMMLGYAEIQHCNDRWLEKNVDGTCRGCAIGAALYAMGVEAIPLGTYTAEIAALWPWTRKYGDGTLDFMGDVTVLYQEVLDGHRTIEQLVEWVRSVEPPDALITAPIDVQVGDPEYATVT